MVLPESVERKDSMEKELIDTADVAVMLDVSRRQVAKLRDRGALPSPVRIGRSVKFRVADIREWIKNGCRPVTASNPTAKRVR